MERVVPRSRAILGDGAARLEWAPLRAAARLLRGLAGRRRASLFRAAFLSIVDIRTGDDHS
ncbi:MAG: hypothetical protein V8Q84_05445 [Bilophila sp.]